MTKIKYIENNYKMNYCQGDHTPGKNQCKMVKPFFAGREKQ